MARSQKVHIAEDSPTFNTLLNATAHQEHGFVVDAVGTFSASRRLVITQPSQTLWKMDLCIAKNIEEAHGGKVLFTRIQDGKSRFVVQLFILKPVH